MSNKMIIILLLVLSITIPAIFIYRDRQGMSIKELNEWIITGYTKQFCSVVFPQLADCVTLASTGCEAVATQTITACTNEYVADGKFFSPEEAQEKYKEAGMCFQRNMHDIIMQQYLVSSEVCKQKMK